MGSYRFISYTGKSLAPKYRKMLVLILLLLVGGVQAYAQDSEAVENRIRAISHQLRCPTCQAMSVKESDAGLSQNMKDKIREMIAAGKSDEEILQFFEERYGEWILRSPKKQGFNLILWLTPLVLLVVASLLLGRSLWLRSKSSGKKPLPPLSPSEQSRLEKDLNRFESD